MNQTASGQAYEASSWRYRHLQERDDQSILQTMYEQTSPEGRGGLLNFIFPDGEPLLHTLVRLRHWNQFMMFYNFPETEQAICHQHTGMNILEAQLMRNREEEAEVCEALRYILSCWRYHLNQPYPVLKTTPLMAAISCQKPSVFKVLLAYRCDPLKDGPEGSAISHILGVGDCARLEIMIRWTSSKYPKQYFRLLRDYLSLLCERQPGGISRNQLNCMCMLLEALRGKEEVLAECGAGIDTPLYVACLSENLPAVFILLCYGCNPLKGTQICSTLVAVLVWATQAQQHKNTNKVKCFKEILCLLARHSHLTQEQVDSHLRLTVRNPEWFHSEVLATLGHELRECPQKVLLTPVHALGFTSQSLKRELTQLIERIILHEVTLDVLLLPH